MRNLLKRLLPAGLGERFRVWRATLPTARLTLIRLWLKGGASPAPAVIPASPRLLFVCHGNILRSALAAALARRLAAEGALGPDTRVESGGLRARPGRPADPRGILVAQELGLDLTEHRTSPVTAECVGRADLILVMDWINAAELLARFPGAAPRTYLLGGFADRGRRPVEIADPYSGDLEAVRTAFCRVESAVRALAARVNFSAPSQK